MKIKLVLILTENSGKLANPNFGNCMLICYIFKFDVSNRNDFNLNVVKDLYIPGSCFVQDNMFL